MRHEPEPDPRQGLRHRTDLIGRRHPSGGAVCVRACGSCAPRLWMSARPRTRLWHASSAWRRPGTDLARPALRDGLHVVRRDDRHLQVGLDPPDRLVLADRPGPAATPDPSRPPTARAAAPARRRAGARRLGRRRAAPTPSRALDRRSVAHGRPTGRGPRGPAACAAAGLTRAPDAAPAARGHRRRAAAYGLRRPGPRRRRSPLGRRAARAVRIGPFVEPGRTACLRCVDAHLGDVDPRRATVLHQLEELPAAPIDRPGSLPGPARRSPGPCATSSAALDGCPTGPPLGHRHRDRRPRGHPTRLAPPSALRLRLGLIGPASRDVVAVSGEPVTTTRCRACSRWRGGARASRCRSRSCLRPFSTETTQVIVSASPPASRRSRRSSRDH